MIENILFYTLLTLFFPHDAQYHVERYLQYISDPTAIEHVTSVQASDDDIHWMALNIYHESRNQSMLGKMAVAFVTMNRVNHKNYPNTIKEVVQEPSQFSWYNDGESDKPHDESAWRTSKLVAKLSVKMYNDLAMMNINADYIVNGAIHYHADYASPYWKSDMLAIMQIDTHIFYKP